MTVNSHPEQTAQVRFELPRAFETDRLRLVRWGPEFAQRFIDLVSDPRVVRYISGGRGFTVQEATLISDRYCDLWTKKGAGPWGAFETGSGAWVGHIGLDYLDDWPGQHRWEVAFKLSPLHWGRGLATEGVFAVVERVFACSSLDTVIAVTSDSNRAARRVISKAGMVFCGERIWKNSRVVWYAADRTMRRRDL